MKIINIFGAATVATMGFAGTALADKPENPGCFGKDRAAILHSVFIGNKDGDGDDEPGASAWGAIAGERAGTNGEQNRAYKESCGGGQPSEPS